MRVIVALVLLALAIVFGGLAYRYWGLLSRRHGYYRRTNRICACLAILSLAGAAVVFAVGASQGGGSNAVAATHQTSTTSNVAAKVKPSPPPKYTRAELIKLITIETTSVDCVATVREHGGKVKDVLAEPVIDLSHNGANASVAKGRRIAGGVNTALSGKTPTEKFGNLTTKVCSEPFYLCIWGRFFQGVSAKDVGGDINFADHNPWLKKLVASDEDINDCAVRLTTIAGRAQMSVPQLELAIIAQNQQFRYYAERVATLLDRFTIDGYRAEPSVRSYRLVGEGDIAGALPEVQETRVPDTLPALILVITPKGGQCPLVKIGANGLDSRPEEFAHPTCKSTPGSPTPGCHCHTTPTTRSTCNHCGTTPPTEHHKDNRTSPTTIVVVTCDPGFHMSREGGCVPDTTVTTHPPATNPPTSSPAPTHPPTSAPQRTDPTSTTLPNG